MKRTLYLLMAIALMLPTGCKDWGEYTPDELESMTRGAEIYESWSYTPSEFGEFIGESFDDYCDYLSEHIHTGILVSYSLKTFVYTHRCRIDSTVAAQTGLKIREARNKWTVDRYNFTYKSVSYSGEPITLSAALIVPAVQVEGVKYTLDAMSLCPPHMAIEDGYCPTASGTILMGRVMYNHAVVVPDYQGRGVTGDQTYSCLHTHDHAVQAIDAALAAKSLLSKLGYEFKDGFELYNVGVSEGGENSYEIQKQIENDVTATERKFLNLKHTFSANGSLDHVQYVKDKIARVEYDGDQEQFEDDMKILKDAFECLTPEEKQGYDASILYSPDDIVSEDGVTLNADHPVFKALEEAMVRNNVTYNWDPKSTLRLAGSNDDTTIKLESHAIPAYDMLKCHPDGSVNENVSLDDFDTPFAAVISKMVGERYMIAHIVADLICFVHAIEYEDPATVDVMNKVFK